MNIILLGPPGAGKGTQALRISQAKGVPQISTGEIFRRAISEKTALGLKAKTYIDAGELVPDDIVIAIIKERLLMPDCQNGYLLDGFPRTLPQAEVLDTITVIDLVINLTISDDALVERLSGRRVCEKCGASYHISRMEGISACTQCGGELIQRNDDKPETVMARLTVYHRQTAPLIAYYERKGLVRTVDTNREVEETSKLVRGILGV